MAEQITTSLEVKTLSKREFEGYGSIAGNVDYGNDIVMPGAFKATLADHESKGTLPLMFWMHNPERIPGKWLEMREDSKGLYVKGVLADTELGNEIHTLLGMKAVSGLSIGYQTLDRDYDSDGNRLLKQVSLHETSIVSLPMNPKAQIVHTKSRLSRNGEYVPDSQELAEIKNDIEKFLMKKGFGRRAAIAGVSGFFNGFADATSEGHGDRKTVETGLSSFQETLLKQDLDKALREVFPCQMKS